MSNLFRRRAAARPSFLGRFRSNRAGNIAMMFGLAAIPFFAFGGMAVDFSRALMVKNRLESALDATALALGGQLGLTDAQVQAAADSYFRANYPDTEIGHVGALRIAYLQDSVSVAADATVDTLIMGIIGFDELTVSADVEVQRTRRGLEVALVLDTTGSMSEGTKMPSLKAAANDLINILFGDQQTPELLRIGVVPFAAAVRLDPATAIAGGWIDTTGTSSIAQDYYDSGRFAYQLYAPLSGTRQSYQMASGVKWRGCVEARPNGLEATDTAPSAGSPDTRWVAYMQPDEPSLSGYNTSYISNDGSTGTWDQRLRKSSKYANVNSSTPHSGCGMEPVLALTNNRSAIVAKINALQPSGNTHIPLGLAWGWRVLSPTAPFTEGSAYNDEMTNKALVLMTDGVNTVSSYKSSTLKSTYSAYGYAYKARLGTTNPTTIVSRMNDQVAALCTAMKAPDVNIRIYTILLEENDTTVRNLLRDCATTPSLFFDNVSAAQLQTVFRVIAADLSNLRVSQ